MQNYTITDLQRDYGTQDQCLDRLFNNQERICSCGSTSFHRIKKRKVYACNQCRKQICPLAGTIFEKSSTPLPLWFYAIYLMGSSKQGVSAKNLQRQLGVTYKCAWRMGHLIRSLMTHTNAGKMTGIVEIDEAYIGGVWKHHAGRYPKRKVAVLGIVERDGNARAVILPNLTRTAMFAPIFEHVSTEASIITDDLPTYHTLRRHRYDHHRINHSKREYVNGMVHTNTIEGFWSILKRSLRGTHVSVSPQHLQSYINEIAWKYNERSSSVSLASQLLARAELPL